MQTVENKVVLLFCCCYHCFYHMSLDTRKLVFGVSDQVRLKPACAATEVR